MKSVHLKFPQNPCENANYLSKAFFLWTIPFLKTGYMKILELVDVYEPLTNDKSELLGDRLEKQWNENESKVNRSLLSVIFYTFWKNYALLSLLCFSNEIIFKIGQPFLLGFLLEFFRKDSPVSYNNAIVYASMIVILNALTAIFFNQIYQLSFHNGMKVRVAVCSLIYRKSLRLSQTALGETSPGSMVNLLSNDVSRFDMASVFVNFLWVAPLLTLIVCCLIWNEAGYVGLFGAFIVLLIAAILTYFGQFTSKYRLQTALKTDERVRFMDEIISGVHVIKMYAWEKPFAKLISHARKLELKSVRKTSYIHGLQMTSMLLTNRLALFATMLIIYFVYGPEQITASKVFVVSTYLSLISQILSQRFARGIGEVAEVLVAIKRIQQFLELDENEAQHGQSQNDENGTENHSTNNSKESTDSIENPLVCISMKNVTARWTVQEHKSTKKQRNQLSTDSSNSQMITLDNVNIEFMKGKLIGLIGIVGAGKSSLLQTLLRELPLESGSVQVNGSISHACQEPWVFAASVRQNILFGQEYNRDRYNSVVKMCALIKDFEQFENGDLTIVGERGVGLSGGQKARINLARACYRNADIYLLDDPLSAVDAHVGTHIFNKCIGPKSRLAKLKSTRILVTHQVHFLKEADWLVVLKDGKVEIQGTPGDLHDSGVDFAELVGMSETLEVEESTEIFSRQKSESHSSRSLSTTSSNSNGDQKSQNDNNKDAGVQMEASSKGKVKGSIPVNYFKAGAHWSILMVVLFLFFFVQFLGSATDYWVSVWINNEEMRRNGSTVGLSSEACVYIQAALVAGLFIFTNVRSIGFYSICIRISQNVHNMMFEGIISTSMRFFDINPSGRILNRFSKDLGAVDENLPKSILDATQNILSMLGTIILAAVINPIFLLPMVISLMIFILIRKIYLKTSQDLKRLEGIVKSPAFTHLSATLNGLPTIRAYNNQEILRKEFDNLQDMHSAVWFMSMSSTSMFGFSLDITCTLFIACIIFYYMLFETDSSGEKIGLAVSQVIGLTGLVPWGMRQSAEIINQMTSVERVLEYCDLEPEKQPDQLSVIPDDWPSKGSIEFRNVIYRYFAETDPVLNGLSFLIKPMEKIGIVGRTGAGKSSLIGSLFRLACVEGDIIIDDINTANIPLDMLRKQIAIIPQDPVLFSDTLRRNLDPFEEYSDADIWNALESVELKDITQSLGLQSKVLPRGVNYSVGQRQLLCLARAVLRKNRILLMDEATANVDPQTDSLIQQTIRNKFTECTVLTVAHRLHTIIDCDRVIVMDLGSVAEFDEPHNLLQNENEIFYDLVKALGEQEFNRLAQIASEKFHSETSMQ